MFKITQNLVRYSKTGGGVQVFLRFNNFASAPISAAVRNIENDGNSEVLSETKKSPENSNTEKTAKSSKGYNSLVAAAFASLKNDKPTNEINTPFTDNRITSATTVGELLSISEGNGVSRRHALKVVSVLAEWSTIGKVQLLDFESDPRFIRLCKILTRGNNIVKKNFVGLRSEDLSTIINVTADDEAAKLITSISLPQMVKVLSTLSQKKRRSTPLLRSLAFNITRNSDNLDLKQSADLLYSVAVLNFIDENLLEKVCADVCLALQENVKGSAVVGSILTSLGILRYKDAGILDTLCEWVLKNHTTCRPLDIFSLFITLATLNHQPSNAEKIYKILIPELNISEANKLSVWLDVVWSLVVLNQAKTKHTSSVLNESFLKKIEGETGLSMPAKLKLLNIDSACKLLIENYTGSRIPENSDIKHAIASRCREKEVMVISVQDSLRNFLNPQTHLKTNVDTGMGFYMDAELALDNKGNPLPLNKQATIPDRTKVAVIVYDYHDMCRGRAEPTGINSLCSRLLEAQGYRIMVVPYTEFNPRDKLVNRVQYLEAKLKSLPR